MKNRSYSLSLDGEGNSVDLERGSLVMGEKRIRLVSGSLSMRRKAPVYKIMIWAILIILGGVIIFSALSMLFFGEGETDPYVELGDHTEIVHRPSAGYDTTALYLMDGNGTYSDLGPSVIFETGDGQDLVSIPKDLAGPLTMGIYFYGDVEFLLDRSIHTIRVEMTSDDQYALKGIALVVLDDASMIRERKDLSGTMIDQRQRTGPGIYDINLDDQFLQQARIIQKRELSLRKGCIIIFEFPDGISEGDISLELQWGPDHFHRTSREEIALGVFIGVLTFGMVSVIVIDLGRSKTILVVNDGETEHVLTGDEEELRSLHYEISKITIRKMKEKEKKETVSMKGAGITRGDSLLDKKDLREVRSDLKRSVVINERVIAQLCPECGYDELYYEGGLMTGHVYHCKRCDYVGSFIIEKELDLTDG